MTCQMDFFFSPENFVLCYSQGNSNNVITTVSIMILYQLKLFKDVLRYKFTVQTHVVQRSTGDWEPAYAEGQLKLHSQF